MKGHCAAAVYKTTHSIFKRPTLTMTGTPATPPLVSHTMRHLLKHKRQTNCCKPPCRRLRIRCQRQAARWAAGGSSWQPLRHSRLRAPSTACCCAAGLRRLTASRSCWPSSTCCCWSSRSVVWLPAAAWRSCYRPHLLVAAADGVNACPAPNHTHTHNPHPVTSVRCMKHMWPALLSRRCGAARGAAVQHSSTSSWSSRQIRT